MTPVGGATRCGSGLDLSGEGGMRRWVFFFENNSLVERNGLTFGNVEETRVLADDTPIAARRVIKGVERFDAIGQTVFDGEGFRAGGRNRHDQFRGTGQDPQPPLG